MSGTVQPRFAQIVERVAPDGTDPRVLHWEARQAEIAGKDVIVLSVGDPDLDTPPSVVETAIRTMQAGDTHYTETSGRPAAARGHCRPAPGALRPAGQRR